MLIYNITLKINWTIQQKWLAWMKEIYITTIMNTGCFISHQWVRLLDIDEEEGPTYALQLYAESRKMYNVFLETYLPHTEIMHYEKWGNDVLFFSTLMEIME